MNKSLFAVKPCETTMKLSDHKPKHASKLISSSTNEIQTLMVAWGSKDSVFGGSKVTLIPAPDPIEGVVKS